MRILINLSVIQGGGGLQGACSLINELTSFSDHRYCFLISPNIRTALGDANFPDNFTFHVIENQSVFGLLAGGRSIKLIRGIEKQFQPTIAFTLFGPSYWKPKVPHVCGFALAQHLYKESPFFAILPFKNKVFLKLTEMIKLHSFKNHCDYWITESQDVSSRLTSKLNLSAERVFTVSNIYNGIFDTPDTWNKGPSKLIKNAEGFKLITVAKFHLHKNLIVIPKVISYLEKQYPDFKYTFVLTVFEEDFKVELTTTQKKHMVFLGKVSIEECPPLYQQSNALFMPTLLECFTVSYLEAMKMQKPILTSDLPFARDICQDAASYFDPMSPEDIGEKIVELARDNGKQQELMHRGTERLRDFGTATDRAKSYLNILEKIAAQRS